MPDKDSFNWIANAVVPGVSALLGGGLGTYLGLFRHRKERGFERRLVWYENLSKALTVAHAETAKGLHEMQYRRQTPDAVLTTIRDHINAIYLIRADELLYASPAVVASIGAAFTESERRLTHQTNDPQQSDENCVRALGEVFIDLFGQARHTIAKDVRRELHLEPLPAITSRPP